jgi:PiT family inorganic phosphate transporter/sodium-dependent phosphate transporter
VLIIWKGASGRLSKLTDAEIIGSIVGTGFGVGLVIVTFFLPYLWVKVVRDDWRINWRYIPLGPFLLMRSKDIPPKPDNVISVQNYYRGHLTREELDCRNRQRDIESSGDEGSEHGAEKTRPKSSPEAFPSTSIVGPKPDGNWHTRRVIWWAVKKVFWHGIDQDVIDAQKKRNILSGDVEDMHARSDHHDNKAEYMYSFLQVLTASAASFTHGANDVSNAVGPFATIFYVWRNGKINKTNPVPTWVLAFGGMSIVLGLLMYGYNIMKNLGNRITLHSPSRGFSMELGAAITVIIATRLSKFKRTYYHSEN